MESFKDALSILAAIVALLTALVTLYAKFLDVKKRAARESDEAEAASQPAVKQVPVLERVSDFTRMSDAKPRVVKEAPYVTLYTDPADLARIRNKVRAPAIALLVAGVLSLGTNLLMAGFGYVDEFVTPLSSDTRQRHAAEAARKLDPAALQNKAGAAADDTDRATVVMSIFTFLCFAVSSCAAIWGGFGMIRLRGYWLSVAGSFAVMPGACVCCFFGFPVGIWSLMVLLKPEVAAAFR